MAPASRTGILLSAGDIFPVASCVTSLRKYQPSLPVSNKMSIADSPDFLFRPEDKALKMLFPSTGSPLHNSFDEFFDKELYDPDHDSSDKESPPLEDIFAIDRIQDSSPTPRKPPTVKREATPQPWRNGLWCLNSKSNSELSIEKTRKTSRIAQKFVSPTYLTGKILSPSRSSTKTISTKPRPDYLSHRHTGQTATRGQTLSLTPTCAQSRSDGRMGYGDTWEQDLQNFHLQMPDNGTYLSPQYVENFRSNELELHQANSRIQAHNATVSRRPESPTKYHYPFSHVLRPTTQYLGSNFVDQLAHPPTDMPQVKTEQLDFANFALDSCAAPEWTTESLHSSDSSHYSHGSLYSGETNRQMSSSMANQTWTSAPLTTSIHYPRRSNPSDIAAPIPHRIPHRVLNQSHTAYYEGLGIECLEEDEIGRALSYEPDMEPIVQRYATSPSAPASHASYPPLPPLPPYAFPDVSSAQVTTIRGRAISQSQTPSPPISPTRRRATSQGPGLNQGQRSPNRRKSIQKAGPIRQSAQSTTTTESQHHHQQHNRARSSSRGQPRTPRTPKTPATTTTTNGINGPSVAPQIGFVNYTPKDSAKLMSDVAPSGSSKTRARREQEAREKRKRLSEAALLAVRRAGGDVTALEGAILV